MKMKSYILALALCATTFGFTSCNEFDAPVYPNPQPVEDVDAQALKLGTDLLKVKVGAENRQEITVAEGNGNYSAFASNTNVAKAYAEGGKIYAEGFANGMTDVVVTDAAGKTAMLTVSVYTTDKMELDTYEMGFKHLVGATRTKTGKVTLGNGDYSIKSNHVNVYATIDSETGEFSVQAKAAQETFTAVVTVSDCTGITADVNVTVESTDDPFDEAFIEEIKQKTPFVYNFSWSSNNYSAYFSCVNAKQDDGTYLIGGDYYNYYFLKVIVPSVEVGTYENCSLEAKPYYGNEYVRSVTNATVNIIEHNESYLRLTYKFNNNGTIEYGYIVTTAIK